MKYIIVIFVLIAISANSQEIFFSANEGYAIGKMKMRKSVMKYKDISFGYDISLKNDWSMNTAVGLSYANFSFDRGDTNKFVTKRFFYFPITLKKYYPLSNKLFWYLQFGIFNNYLLTDKQEIKANNFEATNNKNNLGYNIGLLFFTGLKTTFSRNLFFNVALGYEQDYLSSYKNDVDKISLNRTVLNLGFSKKFN